MHQALTTPPLAQEAKKRRLRRRRNIIFGSAGALLLLIVGLIVASKREKPIPVTTEKAVRRTILQIVSATGKIQPETEVKISPEVAAKSSSCQLKMASRLKRATCLLRLSRILTRRCSSN